MNEHLKTDMEDKEQEDKQPSAEDMKKQIKSRLGEQLHAAREKKNMSITDISSKLRICETYLKALENGDWSNLPEEVYVLGFLRQYAALLNEDIHEDIKTLKSGDYQLTKPFTMPDPPIAPSKMWAITASILFVLLFILFNTVRDDETTIPEPSMTTTQSELTNKTAIQQQATPKAATELHTTSDAPPETSSIPGNPAMDTNTKTLYQTEQQTPSSPATPENQPGIHRYRLMAVDASVWLQVYDPSGILLKEALLHPGQSVRLESSEPFLSVTCGNAAALEIEVDGKLYAAAGTLGEPEKVLHDFKIKLSKHD